MADKRAKRWRAFVEHVQTAPGASTADTRRRVFDVARADVPADGPLLDFAAQVAEQSYRITARTVDDLHAAGHSDDEIFETIVVASVGAADRRLRAAHRALGWD